MQKSEKFHALILNIFEKPLSGWLQAAFRPKTSKQHSPKKAVQSILSLDVTATLSKILESSPPQSFIKLHLGQLWPVLVRKHQNKNFLKKKISQVNFKNLCCCNFMEKIGKNSISHFFINLEHFGPFCLKSRRTRLFLLFKLDDTLPPRKKSK